MLYLLCTELATTAAAIRVAGNSNYIQQQTATTTELQLLEIGVGMLRLILLLSLDALFIVYIISNNSNSNRVAGNSNNVVTFYWNSKSITTKQHQKLLEL